MRKMNQTRHGAVAHISNVHTPAHTYSHPMLTHSWPAGSAPLTHVLAPFPPPLILHQCRVDDTTRETAKGSNCYDYKYDEEFVFPWAGRQAVEFEVWDADKVGKDEMIGGAQLNVESALKVESTGSEGGRRVCAHMFARTHARTLARVSSWRAVMGGLMGPTLQHTN